MPNTVDLIVGAIVTLILGLAIAYIVKAKKSGQKCIGCPHSKTCASHCSCASAEKKNEDNEKTSK